MELLKSSTLVPQDLQLLDQEIYENYLQRRR